MSIYYLKSKISNSLFIVDLSKKTVKNICPETPEFIQTVKHSKEYLQKHFVDNKTMFDLWTREKSENFLKTNGLSNHLPPVQNVLFDPQQEIFSKFQYQNH